MNDDRMMRRLRAARPDAEAAGQHPALFARIVAEPGDARLANAEPRRPSRVAAWKRPRVLAGGSLTLAGVSAALVLALGGTAATAPAFAVTRESDGSVLVTVNTNKTTQPWAEGADHELAAKGVHEAIDGIETAPGPATSSAPVSCTPGSGYDVRTPGGGFAPAPGTPSGSPVEVLLGTNGTDVFPAGTTGAGTVHLVSCIYYSSAADPFSAGNPGAGNTGSGN
jgi:hypothetical protein